MHARALASLGVVAVAACQADYVHVIVETASRELVGQTWDVSVRAYGDGSSAEHTYRGTFAGRPPLYFTDFNLVLDESPDPVDVRVTVPGAPGNLSGDRLIGTPGDGRDIHILLYEGESELGATRAGDGDFVTLARLGNGLAATWIDNNGVELRTARVPADTVGHPIAIDPDAGASKLRTASQPTTSVFGPSLVAVSWLGTDEMARLAIQRDTDTEPLPIRTLRRGDDVWTAVAPTGGTFAIATAIAVDDQLWLGWYDDAGNPIGEMRVDVTGTLRRIHGFAVGRGDATFVAVERAPSSYALLRRIKPGATGPEAGRDETIDIAALDALALSSDLQRLVTAQRDVNLFVRTYDTLTLEQVAGPFPVTPASRTASAFFGGVSIGSCAIAWPELRDDGANPATIDLRVLDLAPTGAPLRGSRLAHGETQGDHFAPTLACMSPSLAYVSFMASRPGTTTRDILLRKVPSSPAN